MGPIPAKYFWPGFVVAILSVGVGFGAATVYYAVSDGGATLIEAKPLPPQSESSREADESVDSREVESAGELPEASEPAEE